MLHQKPSREKRKRADNEDERTMISAFDPSIGPSISAVNPKKSQDESKIVDRTAEKKVRTMGPTLPPHLISRGASRGDDDFTGDDEQATNDIVAASDGDSDSDSDDGFGPTLPGASGSSAPAPPSTSVSSVSTSSAPPVQRDSWMIVPPTNSDWTSRVDPTKLRNRKFNTGKSAKSGATSATNGGPDSTWLETPDEKRKRLEDEVLGRKAPANARTTGPERPSEGLSKDDAAARRKIKEYNDKHRPQALSALHSQRVSVGDAEKEDDPSARPFDREKDIAGGMKINQTARKEMMKRAGDFSDRFASGRFL